MAPGYCCVSYDDPIYVYRCWVPMDDSWSLFCFYIPLSCVTFLGAIFLVQIVWNVMLEIRWDIASLAKFVRVFVYSRAFALPVARSRFKTTKTLSSSGQRQYYASLSRVFLYLTLLLVYDVVILYFRCVKVR